MRDGEPVGLPDRHIDILIQLLTRAGQVVTKDALIEAAWKDVAVTDNSLEQAISSLRRTLGAPEGETPYIETLARRGYRFRADVPVTTSRYSDEALGALLAPHRAFVDGRAALESLDRDQVVRAYGVFEEITRTAPDYAPAHLGLANALALQFESVRAGASRDESTLARAVHHASEACRLDPSSGEAWATLSFLFHQSHDAEKAIAAGRRAASLEPDNWRHHFRLAYVSWGEERLRAAHRVLKLLPHFPYAHWMAATVHIARQALVEAEHELVAGAAAQDRQPSSGSFRAVGLHLLLGLVRLAAADERAALDEFNRELALKDGGHIYTHEACANAWCAIGAIHLRYGKREEAIEAFEHALADVKGYPVAMAARAAARAADDPSCRTALDGSLRELHSHGAVMEAAIAEAVYETIVGDAARAAETVGAALQQLPAGSSGWMIPVDPLLQVGAYGGTWEGVLTLLRSRAA